MRRSLRFVAGAGLGAAALAGYLWLVGPGAVLSRLRAASAALVLAVLALLLVEAAADGLGVWASMRPLGRGLTPGESVRFALAGDFFDVVSPAGPATSEPIMSRFYAVTTETSYGEALGARGLAKYVKSGTQVGLSSLLVAVLALGGPAPATLVTVLAGAALALLLAGAVLVGAREPLTRLLVVVLAPVVRRVSALYRDTPHDAETVRTSIERLWARVLEFREHPRLVGLIAVGAVLEQTLTALALWVALTGTGTGAPVSLLAVVAVVPLPQVATVAPLPASLGAYDVVLSGALALVTAVSAPAAAGAVLVVRTVAIGIALVVGGLAVALLRGWRP